MLKREYIRHIEEMTRRVRCEVFYLESPSSNIFRVLPLRELAARAHACGAAAVMENTWATPLYQKPLELGIDYSIHSATKYLGGHSDILGGEGRALSGAAPVRAEGYYPGLASDEGHALAETQMTGYSGLMSFVPDADSDAIAGMVKSLDVFEEGPSWGGFESVVNTPGLSAREVRDFEGVPEGLVRISVGLEDADTLIADLDRALCAMPERKAPDFA